ncbi:MAG: hypothetical protein ACK5XA_01455 [Tagaea sp.]
MPHGERYACAFLVLLMLLVPWRAGANDGARASVIALCANFAEAQVDWLDALEQTVAPSGPAQKKVWLEFVVAAVHAGRPFERLCADLHRVLDAGDEVDDDAIRRAVFRANREAGALLGPCIDQVIAALDVPQRERFLAKLGVTQGAM